MKQPKPLTAADVQPKKAKGSIVKGTGGNVASNRIGHARSVSGSQPYGRQMQGPIYKITTGPENIPYGGPVQRVKINYDQTQQQQGN